MSNIYTASTYKTCGGLTAKELIAKSKVTKTQSNDYFVRVGDLELNLTDDYDLSVSDYGHTICIMVIDSGDIDALSSKQAACEASYLKQQGEGV